MWCEAGQCSKTSTPQGIFVVTSSLEGLPTKAKEALSPHEHAEMQWFSQVKCKLNSKVFIHEIIYQISWRMEHVDLDRYTFTGTHLVALHVNCNNTTYFHSFRVTDIPEETKNLLKLKL